MVKMIKKLCLISILAIFFAPSIAYAADITDILNNLRGQIINPFTKLLLIICYIAGIYFMLRALLMLKSFGMSLTQASKPGELGGPMMFLFVGALLIWVPSTTSIMSESIFGAGKAGIFSQGQEINFGRAGKASQKLVAYLPTGIEAKWADLIDTLVLFIEFIGFIAFIRGIFIMSKAGNPGVQAGNVSKGIIHIIGGIIAINFIPTVKIVRNSLF